MSLIINIESTTAICSVALSDNDSIIALKETDKENSHSKLLSVFIEEIFKENKISAKDLSAVAVSKGPGSYTGLRIGVSLAKGLCYGADLPLISVDTLSALAQAYQKSQKPAKNDLLCPMMDARRMEVYCKLSDSSLNELMPVNAMVIDNNSFARQLTKHKIHFFGNGAIKCQQEINHKNALFSEFNNSATYLVSQALQKLKQKQFENLAYFEPYYLKDFVAIPSKNKVF